MGVYAMMRDNTTTITMPAAFTSSVKAAGFFDAFFVMKYTLGTSGMEKIVFNSSYGVKLTPRQVAGEIVRFMQADDKRSYALTIGTDSEKMGRTAADFVTAIVVHRRGNGGRYFWRRVELDNIHTLRDRMWREVIISLEIAKDFLQHFQSAQGVVMPSFDFEIHVDVGENGATRTMIQELVGMVRASNFEARTKPHSYAASKIADRHVARHAK